MAMTKIKGLQMWCRKMTEGYQNVDIANFTTAWRNGLAFCALIHRFRPDLIDFDSLSAENVLHNNKLAFEVAEKELDIPAFLEAEDMARLKVPDKLSVITYVSQYYNFLNPLPRLGGPGVKGTGPKKITPVSGVKRATDDDGSHAPSSKKTVKSSVSPTAEAVKQEKSSPPKQASAGDKCTICQNKVYLLERHMEEGKLYHRSCFRHSALSPTNRVFTRSPFMSPNLSTEKMTQENHVQKKPDKSAPLTSVSPRQEENIKGAKDMPMTKNTAKSNLSSILQRVEGAKKKHSIEAPEREEEPKKSKFQPKSLFEKKEPTKKPEQKTSDSVSMLPLSSMEARRLEKRKQEIVDSEKSHKTNVGAKRAVPLVFQQNDKHSSSSTSSPLLSASSASANYSAKATAPSSGKEPASSKAGISGLNSKKDISTKMDVNAANDKKGVASTGSATENVLRKQSAPSILNLQQKFSAGNNETKSPIAKPRISSTKETPSKPSSSELSRSETNSTVVLKSQGNFPKPAPRKSIVETKSNKVPPERPKHSPLSKRSSPPESSSSADEKSTPRSSSSASPPPLPSCPPPSLPSSQPPSSHTTAESPHRPPPLPSSLPPSFPAKDPSSTNISTTKSSSAVPDSTSHSSMSTSSSHSSSSTAGRLSKAPASKNNMPLSNTSLQPQVVTTSSSSDKGPSEAVLVKPTTKKDEGTVLSGLLTSLAGVRGRSAPTPVVTEVPPTITSMSTTSTVSSSTSSNALTSTYMTSSSRKHSEPAVTTSLKPHISTSIVTHQTKDNTVSNLKPTTSSTPSTKLANTVKPSEVHSILSSLKPVPTSDTTKSSKHPSSSSVSLGMNENMRAHLQSNPKPVLDIKTKTEAKDDKKSSAPTNTKENGAFLKDVHLKRVMPEQKTKEGNGHSEAPPFNITLKKVESSTSDVKHKDLQKGLQTRLAEKTEEKNEGKIPEIKQLSTSNQEICANTAEIPQWKKDIEERKKKLREDITRAEANTSSSYTKQKKERPKSADILSLTTYTKENELDPLPSMVKSPRSDSSSTSVSSSSSSKKRPKSVIESGKDIDSKLDWQMEAERKIAAFALFDSSEDEGKSSALKMKAMGSREALQETTAQNQQGDLHKNSSLSTDVKAAHPSTPKKIETTGNVKSQDRTKHNVKKNNFTEVKHQLRDTEILKSKIELRTVDINISGEGEIKTSDKDIVLQGEKEKNLGTVSENKPLKVNNTNKMTETTERKPSQPQVEDKKSVSAPTRPTVVDKSSPEATSNIGSLSEKTTDAGNELKENDKNTEKDHEQDKTSSPKLKRKITFLGRAESDSTSPRPLRKITVDREFDFDSNSLASSEFEASITKSTAEIKLHDREIPPPCSPPQRPPRTKSQRNKTQSPQQISAIELQQQLMEIDNRLTDLELRGRDLEDSIRTVNTQEEDDEEMMIQWFSLVREKNDLVRQEADLVYLSREQDLEGEQQHIDVQLRYLISKEECAKSPQEKEEEDYLLQRKLDIVNQRSSIVDSMDEDRLRYEEEDRNIDEVLLEKGLTRNASGTLMAKKGLKVAKSTFYT